MRVHTCAMRSCAGAGLCDETLCGCRLVRWDAVRVQACAMRRCAGAGLCKETLCGCRLVTPNGCLSAGVPHDNASHWFRIMQWHGKNRSPRHSVRRPGKLIVHKEPSKLTLRKEPSKLALYKEPSKLVLRKDESKPT